MSGVTKRMRRAVYLGAVSYFVLSLEPATLEFAARAQAQQPNLPPVTVEAPKPQAKRRAARNRSAPAAAPRQAVAPQPTEPPAMQADNRNVARTEGKDTYTTTLSTAGGKDVQPIRHIPQTISVVTRQRLDDQNSYQLEEAMKQTTGMLILQNDVGRSSIFSRGFEITDVLVDGMPAPVSSIMGTQPDLVIADRIEVLKGPNALFAGGLNGNNAGAGATVNIVRKRALDKFHGSVSTSYGSWDNKRVEVDVTGPLNEARTVRARVVGAFQDKDTFVSLSGNQVWVGYGTLEIDLTDRTTLSLAGWHQQKDILPFNGLPAFRQGTNPIFLPPVDRSTFVGASWNRFNNETTDYMAELNHDFENGGRARASVRYSDRFVDYKYSQAATNVNAATGAFTQSLTAGRWWEKHLSADAHVSTPFQLLGQTHNFTFGVDARHHDLTQWTPANTTISGTYNIVNFNPASVPEPAVNFNTRTNQDPDQKGLYGQLRLKPADPVTVILGGRYSSYSATTKNTLTGATLNTVDIDGHFSPYAGLVVDVLPNLSLYASYADVFVPQVERDAAGRTIDPRVGEQYETGLKGSFFNGALNWQTSLFWINDKNRALAVVGSNPTVYVNAGEVEVRGFEAEISGSPLPGWEVFAGYTNTHTEVVAGGTGVFRTFQPEHIVNLWSKYTVQSGPLRNFHVAGGGRYLSKFFATTNVGPLVENGYVVADMQLGYKFNENLSGAFTVTNLFDEVYFTRLGSAALFNFYGEPRAYNLKLTSKW